jgi:hypothetical protein
MAAENNNDTILFSIIKKTIDDINKDLCETNDTGIYFAPELYVAFRLGQEIMRSRFKVFGTENVEWLREINLGNGGPSDIVFNTHDGMYIVIELKLRNNYDAYKADIEKLKKLPDNYCKYFCVLLDSFSDSTDDRLIKLKKHYGDSLRGLGHHSFKTWNNWYSKQIFCHLKLYRIDFEKSSDNASVLDTLKD